MASRIEGKRETSPISSAQVSAVIGPTPGTVLRRLIRSASKGSRCRELTRAYSVFCSRTMLSRLTRSRGRLLSFTSALLESSSRKYHRHLHQRQRPRGYSPLGRRQRPLEGHIFHSNGSLASCALRHPPARQNSRGPRQQ